jgi:hypothetical protein
VKLASRPTVATAEGRAELGAFVLSLLEVPFSVAAQRA